MIRDARGTATSIWAITRILNLFVIFRAIRSMPHFTNYGIIMGTISDGMRNLKAFIGILIVSDIQLHCITENSSVSLFLKCSVCSIAMLC